MSDAEIDFLRREPNVCEGCGEPILNDLSEFVYIENGAALYFHGLCWQKVPPTRIVMELNRTSLEAESLRAEITSLRAQLEGGGENENLASGVRELEWRDRGNHSFADGDRWTIHSNEVGVWYLTYEDESEDAAVLAKCASRDAAKSLASRISAILDSTSGASREGEQ